MSFSFPHVMGFIASALQFVVAGCALRLNRLFGTARVGWSLFFAFSLLALLHLIQSVPPFDEGAQLGVQIEVIYSLISLLLLTGLVHIEIVLKERLRIEREEERLRGELESQVKEKTAHLTKAIGELQSEIAERKNAEEQISRLAYYDTLSGLPNRENMLALLRQALLKAKRNAIYSAVL